MATGLPPCTKVPVAFVNRPGERIVWKRVEQFDMTYTTGVEETFGPAGKIWVRAFSANTAPTATMKSINAIAVFLRRNPRNLGILTLASKIAKPPPLLLRRLEKGLPGEREISPGSQGQPSRPNVKGTSPAETASTPTDHSGFRSSISRDFKIVQQTSF